MTLWRVPIFVNKERKAEENDIGDEEQDSKCEESIHSKHGIKTIYGQNKYVTGKSAKKRILYEKLRRINNLIPMIIRAGAPRKNEASTTNIFTVSPSPATNLVYSGKISRPKLRRP
ncbi:MAG: hypothetical protein ACI9VM_000314 [Candidatus Azotimanducaceae bacterium]|jgi:hypothetical protein